MSMLTFISKRIAAVIILIFLLATVAFVLFRAMPSDPAAMVVSPNLSPGEREVLREQYGLDRSLGYQYFIYIKTMIQGDFGVSFYWATAVSDILKDRIASTAILVGTGILIAAFIDASVTASGNKPGFINMLFYLIPFLFLGMVLIWIFSYRLDLFPIGGMKSPELWSPGVQASAGVKLTDVLYHLFLPLTLIVVWIMVGFLPLVKTVSTGIIKEKMSLLPAGLTTLVAGSALFFGAMATETIFSWPGFHATFIEASLNYDYPLAVGAVIAGFSFTLMVAAFTEVFYAVIASLKS